jgi:hypothetical protein
MVGIRTILSSENSLGKRGIAINLRNVGKKKLIWGISSTEMFAGIGATALSALIYGVKCIAYFAFAWLLVAVMRTSLAKGRLIKIIYSRALKDSYAPYSEDMEFFGDYLITASLS